MRREERRNRDDAERREGVPQIEGLSARGVAAFCDALEFDVHRHQPSSHEQAMLRHALDQLAVEAHAAAMPPERFLIGLKKVWTVTCGREASPDVHDPVWDLVVRSALDAFERAREAR